MKTKTFIRILIIALSVTAGCKIDTPIYPQGVVSVKPEQPGTPGNNTPDPGTDGTYTVGIGSSDSFIYKIDNGANVTVHNVLTLDQEPDVDAGFTGSTNLSAHSLDNNNLDISFSALTSAKLGIFPIDLFSLKSNTMDYEMSDNGTVKFTTYSKDADGFYIIKGYFKVTVIDKNTNQTHIITGSFNNE